MPSRPSAGGERRPGAPGGHRRAAAALHDADRGQRAEGAEDRRRGADRRCTARRAAATVSQVAGGAGQQHQPQADAGPDQGAQRRAEDHQRDGVGEDVREVGVQGQRGDARATARRRRCAPRRRCRGEPRMAARSRGPVTTKKRAQRGDEERAGEPLPYSGSGRGAGRGRFSVVVGVEHGVGARRVRRRRRSGGSRAAGSSRCAPRCPPRRAPGSTRRRVRRCAARRGTDLRRLVHQASRTARMPVTKMPSKVPGAADRGDRRAEAAQDGAGW